MVDEPLQSINSPNAFAADDIAALKDPRPKAAVFAVRAGPPLTANASPCVYFEYFVPQKNFLGIIVAGKVDLQVSA